MAEKIVYGSLITSTKCYNCIHFPLCFAQKGCKNDCCYYQLKLPKDSVVLLKEEYEKLKSLYDSHKDVYMPSNIGNLPSILSIPYILPTSSIKSSLILISNLLVGTITLK